MTSGKQRQRVRPIAAAFVLAALAAGSCMAQTIPSVQFRYTSSDFPAPVGVQGSGPVDFPAVAPPGSSSVTLAMQYQGSSRMSVNRLTVDGPGFSAAAFSPITLEPGATVNFILVFTPLSAGPAVGAVEIETKVGETQYRQSISLRANVTSPRFVLSYLLGPGSNQLQVTSGQTIAFPPAVAGQSVSATLVVANTGTGAGFLNAVQAEAGAFVTSGLPLLPARVGANQEVRFTVTFSPPARGSFNASLSIEVTGSSHRIGLAGQGLAAALQYDFQSADGSSTVAAGTDLNLGSAPVGATCTGAVKITNTGDAEARISSIALTGTGFRITDQPTLPATLAPRQTVLLGVAFTSTAGGTARGQLRIDSVTFTLSATAMAAQFAFTAITADATVTVAGGGVIAFPEAPVGSRTSVTVRIANNGTAAGTVASIAVRGAGFSAPSYPQLPATVGPNGTISFTLVFAPEGVGPLSGTLEVDQTTFTLRGIAAAPPSLPAVVFDDAPSTAAPLQQPAVSLRLSRAYPIDLKGELSLKFTPESIINCPVAVSSGCDDLSVRFAGGGRSVAFAIPANSTNAIFGAAETKLSFQTGSVAGAISLTASFKVGQVDVTPAAAPVKTLSLPAAPPRIRSVQIGSRSATGFEVLISGYSNTRTLSALRLEFQPAQGATLQNTAIDINTETSFSAWYQSAASQNYGSQFTASVSVTVNGKLEDVQSVAVRASSGSGSSELVSASLR